MRETQDRLKMRHLKYNQKFADVPVYGGQMIVHLDKNLAVVSVNSNLQLIDPDLNAQATLGEKKAEEKAKKYWKAALPGNPILINKPKLFVYNDPNPKVGEESQLIWLVNLHALSPRNHEYFFVDAHTGDLVKRITAIRRAVDRRVYNCEAWSSYSACVLEDTINGIYHGRSEGVAARSIEDVDNLYDYLGSIHNYFSAAFSRNGANTLGGLGNGTNNPYTKTDGYAYIENDPFRGYGFCPENAYFDDYSWTGGSNINFCEETTVKDVVGHEYAHGVTYFSLEDGYGNPHGFEYQYESGALSEAYSDIFGEAVEYSIDGSNDWIMGTGFPGGALRNMRDPGSSSDGLGALPNDFFDSNFYCGSSNLGGVHHNSTVLSHAAYLMAIGGTHNGCDVGGIGRSKEEAIFYRALVNYLTISSEFNNAYSALNAACADLYGSSSDDCQNTKKALRAVELDQEGRCGGQPETTPECDFSRSPSVARVTSDKADGGYQAGEVIDIDVYFSELVTSSGNVTVTLNTGGTCSFSVANSGFGSCDYTVSAGQNSQDLDVAGISGSISDQDGNAMTSFVPASNLSQNKNIMVGGSAPEISGVNEGVTYRTDVTPTFSGTGTLNGAAFSSGQTISEDGSYALTVTNSYNLSTTVNFVIEKTTSNVNSLNYSRKKSVRRISFTFYNLNLPGKLKAKNFTLRLNGRRVKIINVRSLGADVLINARVTYTKWPSGGYNLSMNYNYKIGKTRYQGSVNKNNLLTIQ